jgi:hypothetical protein
MCWNLIRYYRHGGFPSNLRPATGYGRRSSDVGYLSANLPTNMGRTGYPSSYSTGTRWRAGRNGFRVAILLGFYLTLAPQLMSQVGGTLQTLVSDPSSAIASGPGSVHGTVINGRTHEPIARALVYTPDNRYAVMTDDEGHFEFKFAPPEKGAPPVPTSDTDVIGIRKVQQWYARNARPGIFFARRPGFLPEQNGVRVPETGAERAEIVITLEPEALIVGHVQLPGVDNTDRIQLELYRQDFEEGHERWRQAGHFTTWTTGEFRFSELGAGTYKLFTVEQIERDAAIFNPRDQLYGFPPVFYSNASDFSSATPIRLAAGATVQANLTVARREYYPVKIGIANPPAEGYPSVEVFLRGHPGPGYSLGYDPSEEVVRGSLPDGGYTLKLSAQGQEGSSGSTNFTVRGGPVEGQAVTLHPNVSLSVKITREFQSGDGSSEEAGQIIFGNGQSRNDVTVALSPVEQFGMEQTVMSQPVPESPASSLALKNIAAGSYWVQVSTNNCYMASATWGGGDVLHRPLTVGAEGASTAIEVTLRNDGAEILGKVQLPETANPQKPREGLGVPQMVFVYFVPLGENSGQLRQTQISQDGMFDATQIAPATYRILAFDHLNTEIGPANSELMRKYESKGVVVQLTPKQTLRLPSPLTLVSEP